MCTMCRNLDIRRAEEEADWEDCDLSEMNKKICSLLKDANP